MSRAGFFALCAAFVVVAAAAAVENASNSSSTQGYMAAMGKMHQGMQTSYSGDADIDFARGMIPHHQGAVEMAKAELTMAKIPRCGNGRRTLSPPGEGDRDNAGMAQLPCKVTGRGPALPSSSLPSRL